MSHVRETIIALLGAEIPILQPSERDQMIAAGPLLLRPRKPERVKPGCSGMIGVAFEMTYTVRTTEPSQPSEGAPRGTRQYWQVSEARLEGERIKASLVATGIDWMAMSPDGFWRPDVRAQFETDDDAFVFMSYSGLVEQTDAFKAGAKANTETQFSDQYMRLAIAFDTGDARYAWLNRSLFVAEGRLLGTGHIEYAVYRIT